MTPAQREAYARAHNSTAHLWAVELRHSAFPRPFRFAQHDRDITVTLEAQAPVQGGTDQLFTATALQFSDPGFSLDPGASASLQIDGVPGTVQPLLTAASVSQSPIEATVRAIAYEVNNHTVIGILATYHLQVQHVTTTKQSVKVQLGYTNAANQAFPRALYTPASNPGLL